MSKIVKDQKSDIQVEVDKLSTTEEKMAFLDGNLFAINQQKKREEEIDRIINEDEKEAQYKKELKDRLIDLRNDINCYRLNGGYDPQHLDDAIDEFTEIETQLKEGEIT
jgi:predicted  nucleic acid-binding Zn-ribbon protein